ncbi:MAG: hypothetical protein HDR43_01185, partial [Mycoplasma sp.]|nr:hypothetical protein [Mycoplasma sp.]
FTEFYEKNGEVLVSGSGSRLVKRDPNEATKDGYYKDSEGKDITDSNGDTIPILYKNGQPGILANPIKASTSTRSYSLIESTSNVYTLELANNEQNALYSFFKNQDISITFENKKGQADPNDPNLFDYYVDIENVYKEYTITSEIKFPIENDNLIQYTFNSDEFIEYIKNPDNLREVYENSTNPSTNPINGQAKLMHMYKVTRTSSDGETKTLTTIEDIQKQIKDDFKELVTLKTTYTPANGVSEVISSNDLSSITTLSNGDRFRIEIVSSNEEDLIYAQQPSPLIFTISGLYEQDIEESLLQYLRVQQNGEFNGEGSFGIYVDDPNNDNDNNQNLTSLLQGYKFMIRVWNSNKTIKQVWTTDIDSVNNLVNGDKVEWKLVAPSGAPVEQVYYNTVADQQNHDANNNKYAFIQVNKTGNFNTNIIANSIGTNPTTDTYPENSGLLIESLKEKYEQNSYISITETEFIRLMNGMNFSYTGINGQGNMISDKNVSDVVVNITSPTRQEFTFEYLIQQGYLKFYSNNIEFNWNQIKDNNGNWLISPGTLSNGDQISIRYQDDTMASYYQWSAPEVSGLKNKSDSMSLLTYVGIGVASLVTLGAFALIYFRSRNKKLKK